MTRTKIWDEMSRYEMGFGAISPGTIMVPCLLVWRLYKPKSETKLIQYMSCSYFDTKFTLVPGRPGARKFPGWPGKNTCSPEVRNYFPKPGNLKNESSFLIFMGIFTNFDKYMHQRSAIFVRNWV